MRRPEEDETFMRELKRKAFHQLVLLYIPAFLLPPPELRVPLFAAWAVAAALIELARLKAPAARAAFERRFGGIIREQERSGLSGSFYTSLGALGTVALFGAQPRAVVGGLLALALADAASPLVGLRFGFGRFKVAGTQRSLAGALAGYAAAAGIALALGFPTPVACLSAAAFSAVDIYPVKPNDNVWIPIVFAGALFALPKLLGA